LSGIVTEADQQHWTSDDLRPYIHHIMDSFGIERLMYGGDWPVVRLAASYEKWVDTLLMLVSDLADAEKDRLFYTNAIEFYKL
jgi:L-fuconolactonase